MRLRRLEGALAGSSKRRIWIFFLIALVVVGPAGAAKRHRAKARKSVPLAVTIQQILADPAVARAHWGISVVTPEGKPVFALNDAQLFEPASNAKLFTTAALLSVVPANTTWTTTVGSLAQPDAQGVLKGNLLLTGVGDPTLSGRQYPWDGKTERPSPPLQALESLADQIVASGVKTVDGDVVGDDSWFAYERYGGDWAWDDLQWDYGAPVSALTVNDNVQYLNVTFPAGAAAPAVVAWNPDVPYYTLENSLTLAAPGEAAHSGIDRAPGSKTVRLYGAVTANGMHEALAIEDPAEFAATALRQMLLARGVTVTGTAKAYHRMSVDTEDYGDEVHKPVVLQPLTVATITAQQAGSDGAGAGTAWHTLASHVSPPVAEDVTVTLKVSQNLHAEIYLRLLGRLEANDGSIAQGARVVRQFLTNAGVDPGDFVFYDGSGLSPADLITPRAATTLLTYAAKQPWGALYRSALPVGGVDGTLSNRFTGEMKGRVFAKTGTLGEVNALSGYLTAKSGKTLVFSVLCNDHDPTSEAAKMALDRIVTAVADSNQGVGGRVDVQPVAGGW
ncbi:MAG: D-alanyl-D-alanine carboxypeptidase/D-alanyl-D-alanine-endopeptidase [Acidobacteriaceae bacterium]